MCILLERRRIGSYLLPHPGKVQIPHPWEGLLCQIPYSPAGKKVKCLWVAGGGGGGMSKL